MKTESLAGDVKQLKSLLTWARKQGIAVESMTCGQVGITIRQQPGQIVPSKNRPKTADIYREMGGQAFEDLLGDPSESDKDLEPAIKQ